MRSLTELSLFLRVFLPDPMVAVCSATRPQCRNITAAGLHLLNLMDECSFLRSLALELLGHCVLGIRDNKHFYDHV